MQKCTRCFKHTEHGSLRLVGIRDLRGHVETKQLWCPQCISEGGFSWAKVTEPEYQLIEAYLSSNPSA